MLRHVPYYVLTPLIKGDIRARYGIYKEVLTKDLKNELAAQWPEELKERVAFESIEDVYKRQIPFCGIAPCVPLPVIVILKPKTEVAVSVP